MQADASSGSTAVISLYVIRPYFPCPLLPRLKAAEQQGISRINLNQQVTTLSTQREDNSN